MGDFATGLTRMSHGTGNRWHYTKHVPWYGAALLALPRSFLIKTADKNTANVLRLIIYHVFSKVEILERLRVELAKAAAESPAGSDGNLALRTLEQLPYLTAVLMEGQRLSPAIGGRSQRIAPDRELVYDDKWRIPTGTPVGMTVLMMHLDERLYPDPQWFNPERWVDPESQKKAEKMFAPFSRGSRICLGMHLAWAEMCLVVSTLVRRFDFDFTGVPADHFEWESDQFTIGTKGKSELSTLVTFYET
ncbi:hypothetical protein DL766_006137 [Monosporascus sp. MC13-8B]|uniref:Cytochrome P450 n=1 Tax=Monosporascus cannonballus TaxID=155416 RepID=A0ABY0HDN5_9PEZI|nr:hypothetical protein DL762_002823 [Monosporascus cannonballus]RYO97572.1 hypothetical protein DL763_002685 [Monosporascus cannonballus]RYP27948.1 hypothetical protein DL766_006137 [Monosporascus sp. MC13-8B]